MSFPFYTTYSNKNTSANLPAAFKFITFRIFDEQNGDFAPLSIS